MWKLGSLETLVDCGFDRDGKESGHASELGFHYAETGAYLLKKKAEFSHARFTVLYNF